MKIPNFIQTYSGKIINFTDPDISQIDIIDIAQGLSQVCRFSGQSRHFYSVAQHSVLVSKVVPEFKLQALLHAATEAYMGDVPGPLKQLCPDYKKYENKLWSAISKKFGVPEFESKALKEADFRMLMTEKEYVFRYRTDWGNFERDFPPYGNVQIENMSSVKSYNFFMNRFDELVCEVGEV